MEAELRYTIGNLRPYTNYTVHVRAVITTFVVTAGREIEGGADVEQLRRSLSSLPPDPPPLDTTLRTGDPSSSEINILIGDPTLINTGRVM